jgi:hypothetical protein
MIFSHSPAYANWGLQYEDGLDKFHFLGSGQPVMTVDLGSQRVGIGTSAPAAKLDVNGEARATIFTPTSDRAAKENFVPVNAQEVLAKVASLPITRWKFKELAGEHLGPVAQDFRSAFGLGADDKHIATVDADGVALAAIQGLNQKLGDELKRRDAENAELKVRLTALEKLISNFIQKSSEP